MTAFGCAHATLHIFGPTLPNTCALPPTAPEGHWVEAPGRAQHTFLHVVQQQRVVHRAVAGANVLRAEWGRCGGSCLARGHLVAWRCTLQTGIQNEEPTVAHDHCMQPGHAPPAHRNAASMLACGVPPGRNAPHVSLVVAKPISVGTLMHTLP